MPVRRTRDVVAKAEITRHSASEPFSFQHRSKGASRPTIGSRFDSLSCCKGLPHKSRIRGER